MLLNQETITYGIVSTNEEKEMVCKLRYDVYIEEMGKNFIRADHENKKLYDSLDEWGTIFYASIDSKIVATVRLNIGTSNDFPQKYIDIFDLEKFQEFDSTKDILSFASMLIVLPEYRGSIITYKLFAKCFEKVYADNVAYNFVLCTPSLLYEYESFGYRRYTENYIDKDLGLRIPLVCPNDSHYLSSVKSPFIRCIRELGCNTKYSPWAWFEENFPQYKDFINMHLLSSNQVQCLSSNLNNKLYTNNINLFNHLPIKDITLFLKKSSIISFKKGATIFRKNDFCDDMYILLNGEIQLLDDSQKGKIYIENIGSGKIFGQHALISRIQLNFSVHALTDVDMIIVSKKTIDYFIKKGTDLSNQLLNFINSI